MPIKVWMPGLYSENHRRSEDQRSLSLMLGEHGVHVVADYEAGCDAVFAGSITVLTPELYGQIEDSRLPVIHYCWDIYPFHVNGPDPVKWQRYIRSLESSARILVPSYCTSIRVKEFSGRESFVVKSGVRPWKRPASPPPPHLVGGVVDVMRAYGGECNVNAVQIACDTLGLPCVSAKTGFSWDDFRHAVINARVLVSAYHEASTGGLTLVEGFWHGVPSLVSDSPFNGVSEYMGENAVYFHWESMDNLKSRLLEMWKRPPVMPPMADRRRWVIETFAEDLFAKNVADHIRESV